MIQAIKRCIPAPVKKNLRALRSGINSVTAKYYCPVCRRRVNSFRPLPDQLIENLQKYENPYRLDQAETCAYQGYLCPFCWASDRDRLYALYIKRYLKNVNEYSAHEHKEIKILDIAPSAVLSKCIQRYIMRSHVKVSYRTADMLMEDVDDQVDITDMKDYADEQFDFFICSHVLEHVPDDKKALSELFRILKRGGQGILMVPIILGVEEIDEDPTVTDAGERWRRFGQDDHIRLYSKQGFIERVAAAGFQVHQYGEAFFGKKLFTRSSISSQSVLYVVEK